MGRAHNPKIQSGRYIYVVKATENRYALTLVDTQTYAMAIYWYKGMGMGIILEEWQNQIQQ